jgi:tight adherence protein B
VRRLTLIVPIVLAAVLAGGALGAGSGGIKLIEARSASFPVRTFVLSLPNSRELNYSNVQVTESGQPVADLTVVPASQASKKTFGVVLVVDASDSMAGVPIRKAVAAERAFAARRNPNQQLGVIAFSNKARVVLPLTASAAKIDAALASTPKLAFGTHIFDAVAQAEAMLTQAKIGSGSVVVLSDGADIGSRNTVDRVAAAAQKAHIRLFAIGLKSKTFKPASLQSLAVAGGGDYTLAKSTNNLTPLFDQLGQLLSNEYLISYKSLQGPSKAITVKVAVNGLGATSTAYQTPALPAAKPPAPYNPSLGNRVWGSWITVLVLALLGAAVTALLVIGVLQPRRSTLPARMAEFVTVPGLRKKDDRRRGGPAPDSAEEPEQKNFWDHFAEILEIADIRASREAIVLGTIIATLLTFLIIYLGTASPWWALFALALPVFSREWVIRTLARRRSKFAEQLPDALQVIASALRSGHSFAGALAVVVESSSEPMKSEMQRVVADEQLGVPLQQSLGVVAERMASRDVEQVALVAELQREAGGNAAEVVDRVAETVRERFELRRLIQTLTVQGRMSRWIVSALPVVIILILQIENPHYLHPLLASTAGKVVFGLAAAWCAAGSYAIKRIVDIKV